MMVAMARRAFIWFLTVALVAAPIAPAWAMVRHALMSSAQASQPQPANDHASHHNHAAMSAAPQVAVVSAFDSQAQTTRAHVSVADKGATAACTDGRCDAQCCTVCMLSLSSLTSQPPLASFGVNVMRSYRPLAYTSFISSPFARPPQA